MPRLLALASACLVLLPGCIGTDGDNDPGADIDAFSITDVRARHTLPLRTDDSHSHTLVEGAFGMLPALSVFVDVQVPIGNGLPVQQAHMGVFLPDMPGCDLAAASVSSECRVPIIADVGPYYGDGDADATSPETARLGGFLIENFVPHGYAVAQVSVLGTGRSGGCMDLMGEVEQAGIQAAVEWLGTQAWSNGNVGLIGRSYDGSTPWEAAMAGSEHLKTVVPISGLYGQKELMWRNGSAESRGPGLLWGIYYAFALTPSDGVGPELPFLGPLVPSAEYAPTHVRHVAENTLCPDTQTGGAQAVAAYLTGDGAPQANAYWAEREFGTETLENYKGSVYFIHGLQDWNVDPHMAFPFYQKLESKGLEMRGLFGQWGHMYPDRPGEHENLSPSNGAEAYPASVRWDWAQDLLEWFNHYLKGTGPEPALHVEVQDDHGAWRIEPTFPPRDAMWTELVLGEGLAPVEGDGLVLPVARPMGEDDGPGTLLYRAEPLTATTRIAGLPQLHLTVTPGGAGGQLYAELRDADDGGRRIGHAIMDLRFAAGGDVASPVAPGVPLEVRMQFEPLDAVVQAGHALVLFIANTGRDYLPSAVSAPVRVDEGVLRLPVIQRGAEAFFAPPGDDAVEPVA